MDSKREESGDKARAELPSASLTDADLHDEIQAYEESDQYVYGESGYDDDAKVSAERLLSSVVLMYTLQFFFLTNLFLHSLFANHFFICTNLQHPSLTCRTLQRIERTSCPTISRLRRGLSVSRKDLAMLRASLPRHLVIEEEWTAITEISRVPRLAVQKS